MSSGWLSGWSYRKKIIVTGSTAGEVTDYQIRIVVHYGSGTDTGRDIYLEGNGRTDFGDVRFTADDGVTELPYWIQQKVDGDYAVVWVKIPYIPAYPGTTSIYIYYGNPNATTTSNGANTWLLFDDFEGTNPLSNYSAVLGSISDWEVVAFGEGNSAHYKGAVAWYLLKNNLASYKNLRVLARIYPDASAYYYVGLAFRIIASNTFYFVWLAYDGGGYAGSPRGTRVSLYKRVNGTDTHISSVSTANLNQVWSYVEACVYNQSLKVFLNNEQKITATDTDISGAGNVGFVGLYNGYYDNLAVGKYIDPEPTLSVEETQPTESITPVTSDALTATTLDVTQVTQPTESIVSVSSDALATASLSVTQVTYPSEAIAPAISDALASTVVGVGGYPAEAIASVVSDALGLATTEVTTAPTAPPTAPTKKTEFPWWLLLLALAFAYEESKRRKR